jgi:hypothetical protein
MVIGGMPMAFLTQRGDGKVACLREPAGAITLAVVVTSGPGRELGRSVSVLARNLKRGDRVRWYALDLFVERVELDPLGNVVFVVAGGRRLTFDWDARVQRLNDA